MLNIDASKIHFGAGFELWSVYFDMVEVGSCCNKGTRITAYDLDENVIGNYPNGMDAAIALVKNSQQ